MHGGGHVARELGVRDGLRRHQIHRSGESRRVQHESQRTDHVDERDPAHPLPAIPEPAPCTESEREQHLRERTAGRIEHDADAQMHHADARVPCRRRRRLPRLAHLGEEVAVQMLAREVTPTAPGNVPELQQLFPRDAFGFLSVLLLGAVAVPIAEEFLFRGFLFLSGETIAGLSAQNQFRRVEALGGIESADRWIEIGATRNMLVHDYPTNVTARAQRANQAWADLPTLIAATRQTIQALRAEKLI